jgi:hypothetical protein
MYRKISTSKILKAHNMKIYFMMVLKILMWDYKY